MPGDADICRQPWGSATSSRGTLSLINASGSDGKCPDKGTLYVQASSIGLQPIEWGYGDLVCANKHHCLRPHLGEDQSTCKQLENFRDQAWRSHLLFFVCQVTDFSPKAGWISTGLPHTIERMLAYLFNVSAALALINMAPVFYFDGQAALDALLGLQGV